MQIVKIIVLNLILLFLSCKETSKETAEATPGPADATYYFIRHADKERGPQAGDDPELTEKGTARAKFWAETLKDVKFDAVYSTDFKRTRNTALPVARANNLPLQVYDAQNLYGEQFQKATAGKTVLIVGHSNTTPAFVNAVLGTQKFEEIDDSIFGNLYVVHVKNGVPQAELQDYNDWSFD